ncbi:MAG: CDP-alcohol phosphatidyltransferase family protein, partial [Chloroflexota bacterium]
MMMGEELRQLRWRWAGVALIWFVAWLGLYAWLRGQWVDAGRWLWLSGLVLVYGLWVTWRDLPLNRREGETAVLPTLGLGNLLTLWRGLAVSFMAGFLFSPWPDGWLGWLPMLLYTSADVADYLDGYAARLTNHATLLGAHLDMEFDGLGMLVVSLLAVSYGQLPVWYLSLGLARYLFVFGLWWRERRGLPVSAMPPSVHRRIFAGFQMGFMSAVLWPIVPAAGATIAGTIFATATGAGFLRDWLVAIGWLRPQSAVYRRWQQRIYRAATKWLPPLLRVVLLGTAVTLLTNYSPLFPPSAWRALFTAWHLPWPLPLAILAMLLFLAGVVLLALGVMGRVWALLLVFPVGFDMITQGATWVNGTVL